MQETLKIASLFIQLIPFIETGAVQVVPNPVWFNQSLRQISWKMAEQRRGADKVDPERVTEMEMVLKDDFRRSLFGMPEEYLRKNVKKSLPNLSDEEVAATVADMKAQHARDPLAVLQPSRPGEKNAQMLITHVAPNFEMGFFLAQITGSVLYTDNQYRWGEIISAADGSATGSSSYWAPLAAVISELIFEFELNPWVNLGARQAGHFGTIRKAFRDIVAELLKETDPTSASAVVSNLMGVMRDAHAITKAEWETVHKRVDRYSRNEPTQAYSGRLDCVIANRGFGIDAIRRLLLTFGTVKHWAAMPMAFRFGAATEAGSDESC
jgi:hypothetical protein